MNDATMPDSSARRKGRSHTRRPDAARWRACALTLLALSATQFASAATVIVSANGNTSLDNGVTQLSMVTQQTALPNGGLRVTGTGQSGDFDPQLLFDYVARVNGLAEAGPGTLKAKVFTSAIAFSHNPNVPALVFTPRAEAGFQASFSEPVEVKHPTLAPGSPVKFNAILDMEVFGNEPAGFAGTLLIQFAAGPANGPFVGATFSFPNGLFTSVPDLDFVQVFPIDTVVGAFITVSTRISVAGLSRAGPTGTGTTFGSGNETIIDASNTIRTFLDPVTPGLVFASESGHNYALNSVPLPAGAWLLLSALATAAPRALRRRG